MIQRIESQNGTNQPGVEERLALPSILMRSWNTSFLVLIFPSQPIYLYRGLFLKWFPAWDLYDGVIGRFAESRAPVLKD